MTNVTLIGPDNVKSIVEISENTTLICGRQTRNAHKRRAIESKDSSVRSEIFSMARTEPTESGTESRVDFVAQLSFSEVPSSSIEMRSMPPVSLL